MRGGWWEEDWEGQDSGQGGCKYLMQYALMYWNIYIRSLVEHSVHYRGKILYS